MDLKLKLFYNKSVNDNASYYYERAKEKRDKIEGVKEAIEETKKKIEEAKNKTQKKQVRKKRTEWYEKFHYAFTSNDKLILGGKDAQQNDLVVKRHMEKNDLFFHADIQGGSAVVLKDGLEAKEKDKKEAAQLAASFSQAWKEGITVIDVYAAEKNQLKKHSHGEYVATGAFIVKGEREWFKSTELKLRIGKNEDGKVVVIPNISNQKLDDQFILIPAPGGKKKGKIARSLSNYYDAHPDNLLQILPNGKSRTVKPN